MAKGKLQMTVTIEATFDISEGQGMKDAMEAVTESLERLREQGSAEGTFQVNTEGPIRL